MNSRISEIQKFTTQPCLTKPEPGRCTGQNTISRRKSVVQNTRRNLLVQNTRRNLLVQNTCRKSVVQNTRRKTLVQNTCQYRLFFTGRFPPARYRGGTKLFFNYNTDDLRPLVASSASTSPPPPPEPSTASPDSLQPYRLASSASTSPRPLRSHLRPRPIRSHRRLPRTPCSQT